MRYRSRDWLEMAFWSVIAVGMVVLLFFAIRDAYRKYHQCVDNGGHFERYNCHTWSSFDCTYDTNGNLQMCTTNQHESCDEKCVGASAESQNQ